LHGDDGLHRFLRRGAFGRRRRRRCDDFALDVHAPERAGLVEAAARRAPRHEVYRLADLELQRVIHERRLRLRHAARRDRAQALLRTFLDADRDVHERTALYRRGLVIDDDAVEAARAVAAIEREVRLLDARVGEHVAGRQRKDAPCIGVGGGVQAVDAEVSQPERLALVDVDRPRRRVAFERDRIDADGRVQVAARPIELRERVARAIGLHPDGARQLGIREHFEQAFGLLFGVAGEVHAARGRALARRDGDAQPLAIRAVLFDSHLHVGEDVPGVG
jgi:hypothetical protein